MAIYNNVVTSIGPKLLSAVVTPFAATTTSSATGNINILPSEIDLAFGNSGAGKINAVIPLSNTLVGTHVDIDLTAVVDPYGATKTFTSVMGIFILNKATTTAFKLVIDASSSVTNGWTNLFNADTAGVGVPQMQVGAGYTDASGVAHPGIFFRLDPQDGIAVAGANKVLRLDSGANTVPYEVYLLGVTSN